MNKPSLSIIVPTYNPGEHLVRLLDSLLQNSKQDEFEIILSDDCSTENLMNTVKNYPTLNIRIITNDHHAGFPRDGRQNGANVALGEWFTFTDQDDYWLPHAIDKIMDYIMMTHPSNYIVSDFIEESIVTGQATIMDRHKGWTHGKFYEKKFWNKYGIHYDDVQYCEDIDLSNRVDCIITMNRLPVSEYSEPLYVWRRRGDSLADEAYFRKSMPDYITSTLGVLCDYVEQSKGDKELYDAFNIKFLVTFLHIYFYFQSELLWGYKPVLFEAIGITQPILDRYKKITGETNVSIVSHFHNDLLTVYQQTRTDDFNQIPFVEQVTIAEWMRIYFEEDGLQ